MNCISDISDVISWLIILFCTFQFSLYNEMYGLQKPVRYIDLKLVCLLLIGVNTGNSKVNSLSL